MGKPSPGADAAGVSQSAADEARAGGRKVRGLCAHLSLQRADDIHEQLVPLHAPEVVHDLPMWPGGGFSRGADAAGVSPVPVQMWAG